jgi:hypothetical protein
LSKRAFHEFPHRMGLPGRQHVIITIRLTRQDRVDQN